MTPPFFPFVPNSDRISTGDRITADTERIRHKSLNSIGLLSKPHSLPVTLGAPVLDHTGFGDAKMQKPRQKKLFE